MRRLLLVLLLCLVSAAPAAAQAGRIVTSADGYDLYARHGKHGGVCVTVLGPSDSSSNESRCERVFSAFHPVATFPSTRRGPVGLAVPGTVVRVAVGDRSFDTLAVAGFGPRFVLLTDVGSSPLLRFYDAGGVLVGAAQNEFDFFDRGGETVFTRPGTRIRVRRAFDLDPTPLSFDRTVPKTCLIVAVQNGSSSPCTRDEDLGTFDVEVAPACAPARSVLYGLVSDRVRTVVAVLGDGSPLTVRPRALRAGLGPGRLVAASVPRGLAVRSVRSLDSAGRVLGRRALGAAPSGLPCPSEDDGATGYLYGYASDFFTSGPRPTMTPVTVAKAGGRAFRVADGPGVSLCTGIGRRLACATPPVDAATLFIDRQKSVIDAVLSADVAGLTITLKDGTNIEATVTDGPAYTGRYAGRVRFLAAVLPDDALVERAVPHAADGHRVGTAYIDATERSETSTARRFAPGLRIVRSTLDTGDGGMPYACLQPRRPLSPFGSIGVCGFRAATRAFVSVTCVPRRTIVFGTVRGRHVRLRLSDSRTLRPRVRTVKAVGRVWTAVVPRGAGVESYRTGGRDHALRVPPADGQCGYETFEGGL